MSAEIARGCDYYCLLYLASDDDPFKYSKEQLASCEENLDFLSWLLDEVDEAASPHTWERAQQVRRLVPTNPL